MSLAPKSYSADRVYDALPMSQKNLSNLQRNRAYFLNTLEGDTRCTIVVPEFHRGELQTELGFFGSREAVAYAKSEVLRRLVSYTPPRAMH